MWRDLWICAGLTDWQRLARPMQCQCANSGPIKGQSIPRFGLAISRQSEKIEVNPMQCKSQFGANRGSARQIICCQSNANRPPVSFQPSADGLPIRWQSCANPFPILFQSVSNSHFNPVPIHHQSIHIFVLSFNSGNLQKLMIIRHAHKIGAELNPPDIIIIIMPFLSFSVLIWSWVGDLAVFCIIAILIFSVWNW